MQATTRTQPSAPPPRQRAATHRPASKGGYTQLPNELDYLCSGDKISGVLQFKLLHWILRHTLGAKDRPEWAQISLGQFVKLCGAGTGKGNVHRSLADLIKRGLVAAQSEGSKTSYKLTPEKWKDAPDYEFTKKEEPPAAPEEEAEEDAEGNPKAKPFGGRMVIRTRKTACVPARLTPKGRDPLDFRIRYANEGNQPVEVSASSDDDVLLITLSAKPQKEEKAKGCLQATPASPSVRPRNTSQNTENTNVTSFDAVTAYITDFVWENWHKAIDPALLAQIVAAANGAPVETLRRRFQDRLPSPKVAARHKPVLLVNLARDAAKDHALALAKETAAAAPAPDEAAYLAEHAERMARLKVEDPETWELIERQSREA